MKTSRRKGASLLFFALFFSSLPLSGQLVTMSNKCYKQVESAKAAIESGSYDEALTLFDQVLEKCSAKDAQQEGNVGKAMAYNGLGRHQEAIAAADAALAVNEANINALFERGVAHNGLNDASAAQADFDQIIGLTEKNKNVKDRATIYAKVGELYWKQGMQGEALQNVDKAIELDPENASFYVLRGDMRVQANQMEAGMEDYEKARSLGMPDQEIYVMRTNAVVNAMQGKYGTTNVNELGQKMSDSEKEVLCRELELAFAHGLKDMQLDLMRSMICK